MKTNLWMLSAAIALCVLPGPDLAQVGGQPWRPDMSIPPNWQPGPGGTRPYLPSGPALPNNPFFPQSPGPLNPVGPHGILPPEPRVGAFIDPGQNGTPNPAPNQISLEVLRQLTDPELPRIAPPFEPVKLPAAQPPLPALPSWEGWEGAVIGIGILCLLARLLRDSNARKDMAP
jgi:hypothetical protein